MSGDLVILLGTRPEAIKMLPVLDALRAMGVPTRVVLSGQHDLGSLFAGIEGTRSVMLGGAGAGTLAESLGRVCTGLESVLAEEPARLVVVHGDTTTALGGAIAARYTHARVAHVEAGLRTGSLEAPWPEEAHRAAIDRLSDLWLAPTEGARANLVAEGVDPARIEVTGNPSVDAARAVRVRVEQVPLGAFAPLRTVEAATRDRRLVVATAHRRENLGRRLEDVAWALRDVLDADEGVCLAVPVHPNPAVGAALGPVLADHPRVLLLPPLDHTSFTRLLLAADVVATDSGGIQEEAPSLGKRVLVLRDVTERPEGLALGLARLVGCDRRTVRDAVLAALAEPPLVEPVTNPYGDGKAGARIAVALAREVS